jgi:hypothetical protein
MRWTAKLNLAMLKAARRLLRLVGIRTYRVVVDGTDNSVTLSSELLRDISAGGAEDLERATIISFKVTDGSGTYGFAVNAPISAQCGCLSRLQYNPRYGCVGFESLSPTVNRILYDYGIAERKAQLWVMRRRIHKSGCAPMVYYQYLRPNE